MPFFHQPPRRLTQAQFWRYVASLLPAAACINLATGVAITALFLPWHELGTMLLIAMIVGYSMLTGSLLLRWFREFATVPAIPMLWSQLLIGLPLGLLAGRWLVQTLLGHDILNMKPYIPLGTAFMVLAGAGLFGMLYYTVRWRAAVVTWKSERIARAALQARLSALQAQVEPHFLFNTLANLDALINRSPDDARRLITNLNHYLSTSLVQLRGASDTVGSEFSRLTAYLEIMAIRLQDRLCIEIACAADCVDLPFPPMLLHPLVENAVIHGIEPALAGGRLSLRASRLGGMLIIEINDTGLGLQPAVATSGCAGSGLSNVRDRLDALFGSEAALTISTTATGGTCATVRIAITALQVFLASNAQVPA